MSEAAKTGWLKSDFGREAVRLGVFVLAFTVFMPSFLFQPFRIPSRSMESTLLVGDYLWVSKFTYGYSQYSWSWFPVAFAGRVWEGAPKRGDVVVFRLPANPSQDYIKRVVGLPGDRIQVTGGRLYINGEAVKLERVGEFEEKGASGETVKVARYRETLPGGSSHDVLDHGASPLDETPEFVVPARHYFMMGDNRDMSSDSRDPFGGVGFVPAENLVGRAELVFFSHDGSARWWELWKWPFAIRYGRLLDNVT